ncbi:putative hornerin-like [Sesbania bispinosa]|nr:putative hornerin-like [Sesbania bispinosa]
MKTTLPAPNDDDDEEEDERTVHRSSNAKPQAHRKKSSKRLREEEMTVSEEKTQKTKNKKVEIKAEREWPNLKEENLTERCYWTGKPGLERRSRKRVNWLMMNQNQPRGEGLLPPKMKNLVALECVINAREMIRELFAAKNATPNAFVSPVFRDATWKLEIKLQLSVIVLSVF